MDQQSHSTYICISEHDITLNVNRKIGKISKELRRQFENFFDIKI